MYQNVQALRGISASLVLLFHLAVREKQDWPTSHFQIFSPFALFGFSGVDLFFVISGFVITTVNFKHFGQVQDILLYWLKRFFRVFPIYWLTSLPMIMYLWSSKSADWFSILAALSLVPGYANVVNPVSWTLVFEIFFYAIFAVFLIFPARFFPVFLMVWSLGLIAFRFAPSLFHENFLYESTAFGVFNFNFIFGCLVALLVRKRMFVLPTASLFVGLTLVTASVLVAAFKLSPVQTFSLADHFIQVLVFGFPGALILYGLTGMEIERGFVLPKFIQTLGDASYSIYLTHFLVIQTAKPIYAFANQWQYYAQISFSLMMLLITVSTGLLVHFKLEKPLLNLSNKLLNGKKKNIEDQPVPREKVLARAT